MSPAASGPASGPIPGLEPGVVVAGKYRVERVIGQGGMGVVVVAHHVQLDEKVAIKLLLPSALEDAETVGRFQREARAAVKIKSEHVARVIDVGELDGGSPYIVMEYLQGSDLASCLAERGRLGPEEAVGYVLQACEAIAEAHALGIVHRDLKPANLFLASRPSGAPIVKVLDFGISKSTAPLQVHLTKSAEILGSPLYMSPEQIMSSKTADVRSDVWSLGIVLYELLAGRVPFQAASMAELVFAVIQRPHPGVRLTRPDVPPGLEAAIDRCLAKEPAARFATVGELAAALVPFGPPLCHISLDRIKHVLGAPAGAQETSAPHAVRPQPSRTERMQAVGRTGTVPLAIPSAPASKGSGTLHSATSPVRDGALGAREAHVAVVEAGTTSGPVSSDSVSIPGVSSAKRSAVVVLAVVALGVAGIALTVGGPGSERAAGPSSSSSAVAASASVAVADPSASAPPAASSASAASPGGANGRKGAGTRVGSGTRPSAGRAGTTTTSRAPTPPRGPDVPYQ